MDAFHVSRDNSRIKPLDPILVHYAGHGSEVDPPSGWEGTDSKAQCIVPQDVGLLDASGHAIRPNSDTITTTFILSYLISARLHWMWGHLGCL